MEAVGRLAGGIAHDFNNLLMVIQSYTEMLQDSLPDHDPLRKNAEQVLKAAHRASSLTGQMLTFSRKQITSPVVLDLNAVSDETAKMQGMVASVMTVKADAQPRGTGTILIAEDEEALRGAICAYLRNSGYTVLAAGSGQQALAVASEHDGQIDLLITDVVMPKMSGRELSQMLGRVRPDLKTIHMSGYTDDAVLRHGIQAKTV
jgi:CheY-like chemotaxis protein